MPSWWKQVTSSLCSGVFSSMMGGPLDGGDGKLRKSEMLWWIGLVRSSGLEKTGGTTRRPKMINSNIPSSRQGPSIPIQCSELVNVKRRCGASRERRSLGKSMRHIGRETEISLADIVGKELQFLPSILLRKVFCCRFRYFGSPVPSTKTPVDARVHTIMANLVRRSTGVAGECQRLDFTRVSNYRSPDDPLLHQHSFVIRLPGGNTDKHRGY